MRKRQEMGLNQLRTKRSGVRVPPGAPAASCRSQVAIITFVVVAIFLARVFHWHLFCHPNPAASCRSSPRKVTLGLAARLQAPSLTPRCGYQLFAVEGHCSLGIYFVTPTQRQAAAPTSRRTLVVRRIFLRKMRLHRSGCRSSPRKVTLGSAARLQAPSLMV